MPEPREQNAGESLDCRTLMKLPREERHAYMKACAEMHAADYNRQIDVDWLDADLDVWGEENT